MATRRLRDLKKPLEIRIATDQSGLTGRQCPNDECEGYFKIRFGTGLPRETRCYCPYCGHRAEQGDFNTEDQRKHALSVAKKAVMEALGGEIQHAFRGLGSTGRRSGGLFSMEVRHRKSRTPIHHYVDPDVETEVVCPACTLGYAVFGVFGYCPDCGRHNTLDILDKSLVTLEKTLRVLGSCDDSDVQEAILGNAVEDLVSSFDGFGRELVRLHQSKVASGAKPPRSFQSLESADAALRAAFGATLSGHVEDSEWMALKRLYAKRHVVAHRMGVADQKYVDESGDLEAVVGRKVRLSEGEVRAGVAIIRRIAGGIVADMSEGNWGNADRA